jgi:hypothetical protein
MEDINFLISNLKMHLGRVIDESVLDSTEEHFKNLLQRTKDIEIKYNDDKLNIHINNSSIWNFRDLLRKTARRIIDNDYIELAEKNIIRFLERLPSGDYTKLIEEWRNE